MSEHASILDIDPRILARLNCPLEEIEKLCRKFHVIELSVFGSVVRDDIKQSSDIDFLVLFEPNISMGYFEFFDFEEELSQLVGRKIDAVSKKWMRPRFRDIALPQSQVIYAA